MQTKNLNKFFKDSVQFQALKNINVGIDKGEFVSITGASGSGKSTLLYVLSTLDTQYEGEILFEGISLKSLNANQTADFRNKTIGFVFQFHYLLPEFSVVENVMLPGMKLGKYKLGELKSKAIEKLDMLGLKDQAEKKAGKLSGGQQQRAAIARALINDPKIIFGDEPTGNLDSNNSKMVFDIFQNLKKTMGQTIVIVTHDNEMAEKTDRRIILKDGEVIQQ